MNTLSYRLTPATITRVSMFLMLSMADYVLTCYAINSGIGSGGNPVLSWTTLEGIGLLKTLGLIVLIYRYWNKPRVLYFVAGMMTLVVCWNFYVIL